LTEVTLLVSVLNDEDFQTMAQLRFTLSLLFMRPQLLIVELQYWLRGHPDHGNGPLVRDLLHFISEAGADFAPPVSVRAFAGLAVD
jgi:hypothetical protein